MILLGWGKVRINGEKLLPEWSVVDSDDVVQREI